ncbi:60S ribosomal protein L32-1-like protein [Tanacetum coccineum]
MLEGTLKTIEDTMARMDKEAYEVYNEAGLMGAERYYSLTVVHGAATGKLQSRLRGEEDLQGMCFCSEFKGKLGPKLELPYTIEKRGSAPKQHSKGRLDVIRWDFVMYNRTTMIDCADIAHNVITHKRKEIVERATQFDIVVTNELARLCSHDDKRIVDDMAKSLGQSLLGTLAVTPDDWIEQTVACT